MFLTAPFKAQSRGKETETGEIGTLSKWCAMGTVCGCVMWVLSSEVVGVAAGVIAGILVGVTSAPW